MSFKRPWPKAKAPKLPGQMNQLEARYAAQLENRRKAGEILQWKYESMRFVLAPKTSLTPDFFVVTADHTVELHETKGFMRDDANVKLKVAAELFPFKFVLVKEPKKNQFVLTEIPGSGGY
jgi:hypothetical protein